MSIIIKVRSIKAVLFDKIPNAEICEAKITVLDILQVFCTILQGTALGFFQIVIPYQTLLMVVFQLMLSYQERLSVFLVITALVCLEMKYYCAKTMGSGMDQQERAKKVIVFVINGNVTYDSF